MGCTLSMEPDYLPNGKYPRPRVFTFETELEMIEGRRSFPLGGKRPLFRGEMFISFREGGSCRWLASWVEGVSEVMMMKLFFWMRYHLQVLGSRYGDAWNYRPGPGHVTRWSTPLVYSQFDWYVKFISRNPANVSRYSHKAKIHSTFFKGKRGEDVFFLKNQINSIANKDGLKRFSWRLIAAIVMILWKKGSESGSISSNATGSNSVTIIYMNQINPNQAFMCSYATPYKWPYKWVTWVTSPL